MAVAVVLVGVAGVAVFGIGLLGPDRAPTNSSTADGPRAATPTPGPPPFALKIDEIRDCGRTCRDVTSTLRNEQQTSATDIGVTATIYAGRGTGGPRSGMGTSGSVTSTPVAPTPRHSRSASRSAMPWPSRGPMAG
ncbi:hypothetical protein ACFQH8_02085 [Halomicroarcula sp. GCM10025710]